MIGEFEFWVGVFILRCPFLDFSNPRMAHPPNPHPQLSVISLLESVDPPTGVPDGGSTAVLALFGLAAIGFVRRR
ncbi:VPDSG-CTERM sorting domain-containing protein [Candidatus Woesearchaeota archaeon]|nr:VPDSG-CTERM sorting domain-containing protein [Candidatus Woesearchaeota archaeon]